MLLVAFVFIHVWALHVVGSNNPEGLSVKSSDDTLPFHPYFTMKDMYMSVVFLTIYAFFVFYMGNYMGHPDNFIRANPVVTPAHIVPEWYFLPFYAVLRAIPDKLGGVIAMFGAIMVVAVLPWLDRNPIRSLRYRPKARFFFWLFVIVAMLLGFLGAKPAEGWYVTASRILTAYWFIYFLVIVPLLSKMETTNRRMPGSITDAVLGNHGKIPEGAQIRIFRPLVRKRNKQMSVKNTLASFAVALTVFGGIGMAGAAEKAGEHHDKSHVERQNWSFGGLLGSYDKAQLKRGFTVYNDVCSACHGMNLLSWRNLMEEGGPEFTKD